MADYLVKGEFSFVAHGDSHSGDEAERLRQLVEREVTAALSGIRQSGENIITSEVDVTPV